MSRARNMRRLRRKAALKVMYLRPCQPCTECCTAMRIAELDKPQGEKCPHEGAQGCNIYTLRPTGCRKWNCQWRLGVGTMDQRPDLIGIVLSAALIDGEVTVLANETREGALDANQDLLQLVASKGPLLVPDGEGGAVGVGC